MKPISRRDFLKLSGSAALTLALTQLDAQLLDPVNVVNPLAEYPQRDWEKIYRDQYRYDSLLHLRLLAERHARLPAAGLRAQRGHPALGDQLRRRAATATCTATPPRRTGTRAAARRARPSTAACTVRTA